MDKKVLVGGFVIGVAVGTAIVAGSHSSASQSTITEAPTIASPPTAQLSTDASPTAADASKAALPTFDEFVAQVAQSQGGKISLRQMAVLARLYSQATRDAGMQLALPAPRTPSMRDSPTADPSLEMLQRMNQGAAGHLVEPLRSAPSFDTEPPREIDFGNGALSNVGALDVRSGQYLAPGGAGGYVDPRDGTFYAPSGPNGVVNTRTGAYSSVSSLGGE